MNTEWWPVGVLGLNIHFDGRTVIEVVVFVSREFIAFRLDYFIFNNVWFVGLCIDCDNKFVA
ncbi:hypothetical protein HRED_06837 [Candidatus Haloredivivus sp. G17]|nr:hypothetical protein HRED_06837 [Candidatus Haloredivivus sp. G17]